MAKIEKYDLSKYALEKELAEKELKNARTSQDLEKPVGKAQKLSSKSKSKNRADHKHKYERVLLIRGNHDPVPADRCSICGRTKNEKWFFTISELGPNPSKRSTREIILDMYKDLPRVNIDEI